MGKKLLITILLIGIAFGIGSLFWIHANLQPDIQLNDIIDQSSEDTIDSSKNTTDTELSQTEKADSDSSEKQDSNEKDEWLCIGEKVSSASTREVFSTTDYKYNIDGFMIESVQSNEFGDDICLYSFDKHNNCILKSEYTRQNDNAIISLNQETQYCYNDKNELSWKGMVNSDFHDEYLYEDGFLTEADTYRNDELDSKIVYEYANGNLVKIESSYKRDWNDISQHLFEYDEDGKLLKEYYESEDGSLGDEIIYEYNELGELIRRTEDYKYNEGPEAQRDLFFEYEYDTNGNKIKESECDDQWNPRRITEYTYINKEDYTPQSIDDFIGIYKIELRDFPDEPYITRVRLKNGGHLDEISCVREETGTYHELINLNIEVNDLQLYDSIEFIDSSNLYYLYAVDLDTSDNYGNIIASITGEDDTNETVIYAYDANGITKIGEIRGSIDLYSINGNGKMATNESLAGGIMSTGKFVAHRNINVSGTHISEEDTSIGHFEEENNNKKYYDGFTFHTYADLTVYQDTGLDVESGVIPAGSEVSMHSHEVINVVYNGYNITDDAFYVTSNGISGWTTSMDIRNVADDYYAVG